MMVSPLPPAPSPESSPMAPSTGMEESMGPADAEDDNEDIDVMGLLEQRMSEIPNNQKEYVLNNLTPETLGLLGIIIGNEAVEFFAPFTDPNKMIQIIERPQEEQAPAAPTPGMPEAAAAQGPMSPMTSPGAMAPAAPM